MSYFLDKHDDFTFQIVNSPLSVVIFQFHNSYVILEIVPSTVMFWIELSCLRKIYSNKTTLLLGWSHRYENVTVVITIWLTVTKYPYLKLQWIFYYLRRCFFTSSCL